MRLRILLVGSLLLSACAHLKAPDRGGPPWVRVSSDHFDLVTDLAEAPAEAMVRDLEERRAAMLGIGWQGWADPPSRMEVIASRSCDELAQFVDDDRVSFTSQDGFGQAGLVTCAEETPRQRFNVHFFLAYHLQMMQLRKSPGWLRVGLALYLQTLQRDTATGRWSVGEFPAEWVAPQVRYGSTTLVIQTAEQAQMSALFARVHFLFTERGEQLEAWRQALRRGEKASPAFAATFPDLDPTRLQEKVRAHARTEFGSGHTRVATLPFVRYAGSVSSRTLTNAEVHALFARLHRSSPSADDGQEGRVRAELDEALRLDPNEPSIAAEGGLAKLDAAARWTRLQDLVKAHPEDARSHFLLAVDAHHGSEKREQALRAATRLRPTLPMAWALLSEELRARDPAESLHAARQALRLAPWLDAGALSEATALAATGACPEAVAARDLLFEEHTRADGLGYDLPAGALQQLKLVGEICGK